MSAFEFKEDLVSVIIPGYKSTFIIESVECALSQTYPHVEVIVVDDGSPNQLKETLSDYIETGKIRYIYQENQKMAAARNNGIEHSNGEYIAFLDDDDLWLDNKLEEQVKCFKADPETALVYTFAVGFDNDGDIPIPNFHICNTGRIFTHIFLEDFIANSSVMIRKAALTKSGLFNATPAYFGVDDCDMWTRITYYYNAQCIKKDLTSIRLHDQQFSGDRSIMLFNDLNARKQLIEDLDVPSAIQCQYLARIHFDIGYNLRKSAKTKALNHYVKSLVSHFSVKTLLAIAKLPIS